ncbi:MAG TPA: hypothetical protein VFF16_14980 [Telluria sp.]|nr:hypothetical protein [Telluria sp.]
MVFNWDILSQCKEIVFKYHSRNVQHLLLKQRFKSRPSRWIASSNHQEIMNMMEWVPVVLVTFKVLVLGTGMFFAIKWHYDQSHKDNDRKNDRRAVLRASGKVSAVFLLGLIGVGLLTVVLSRMLGLDLTFP